MAYNKTKVLENNIQVIELVLSGKELSDDDIKLIESYQGFGGLKSVLYPPDNPDLFPLSDRDLVPLVRKLHDVLHRYSTDKEFDEYYSSIKNSVLTSFYTPEPVVKAISHAMEGITFNRILEPSAGVGVFMKNIHAAEKTGIEKDLLTGKILRALYPDNEVLIQTFQSISAHNENSFDLVISNIPFGNIPVFDALYAQRKDKDRKKATAAVHNYFFMKGLDMLKDGGLLAFITSAGVMDTQGNDFLRKALLKEAHLISCARLPDNLFQNTGGIEVKSDLIILQKDINRSRTLTASEKLFVRTDGQTNEYYQDLRHVIHTELDFKTNQYGRNISRYYHKGGEEAIGEDLYKLLLPDIKKNFIKDIYKTESINPVITVPKKSKKKDSSLQLSLFDDVEHFASVFEQKLPPEKVPEQIAFEKYQVLTEAYFELKETEERRNIPMPGLRQQLNDVYDSFVEDYGYLSLLDNYLIEKDSYINELRGLELKINKEIQKADIFFEPVNIKKTVFNISIEDALYTSLNELNYVDLDYISLLCNEQENIIKEELIGSIIFFNPLSDAYEPSNYFLSGNVINKLNDIRDYYNTLELNYDPESDIYHTIKNEIDISLKALENVIPEKVPLEEIGINLGERWIPERYYAQFSKYIFNPPGTEEHYKNYCEVKYLPAIDDYAVKMIENSSVSFAYNKFTVHSANRTYYPDAVFHYALMDIAPDMTKTIERDGEEVKIPDTEGIQRMHTAVEEIRNSFQEWISKINQFNKDELESIYNNKFNNIVKAHYDGSYQTFPDLNYENLGISELYPTQKDAILMLKQNGGGIIDHEVGGGKTLIQVVASYEMKRLGIAKKPMILGIKANVSEIASTYRKAYPNAKLLYPSLADLQKDSIDIFLSKIQNNNWDCIIMSHEQFEKIPQSFKMQQEIINEELIKLHNTMIGLVQFDDAAQERRAYKNLEKANERLTTKLEIINDQLRERKNQSVVDFDTMGVDHIYADESHRYKNLGFVTKHNRVAGLGNQKGSQRAQNMLYAIRTMQKKANKDLQATFLSGTTIDNSLTELYNIFNYLRPNALRDQGILSMDGWLATYAIKSKEFEFSVTNDIIQKERFRFFCKVPELAAFYAEITDYKTAEMIGIDRPKKNESLVNLPQTPDQEDMYARLKIFAKDPDGPLIYREPLTDSEEKAKMLLATNAAKNAALDMRLIDPDLFEDHEGNKINACVAKLIEYYNRFDEHRGTQFVFSDLGTYAKDKEWDVYSEIKRKLVDYGIPASEIQFIQNFKTDKKKLEFQKAMNEGYIRIGLGSTEMLGTGVNAQQRAVAVHHLDIPWTPKSFIQRDGRAVRKGNWVAKEHAEDKVDVFIYAVEKTLDVYKFNLQATKNRFISQIKSQTVGVRVIDEGAGDDKTGMSYNEYIAVLSGDTSLLEKARMERRISQLKNEEKLFASKIKNREHFIKQVSEKIETAQQTADRLQNDLNLYNTIPRDENGNIIFKVDLVIPSVKDGRIFLIDNPPTKSFDNVKEAGIALNTLAETENVNQNHYEKVGDFYGFTIGVSRTGNMLSAENRFVLFTDAEMYYKHNNGIMPRTPELAGEFPVKSLERIGNALDKQLEKVDSLNSELAGLVAITDNVFPKKEELNNLEKEHKILVQKIEKNLGSQKSIDNSIQPVV
jgi:N12 class adenine-specific DNA methylase